MFNFFKNILYGNLSPNYAQVVELIRQRQTDQIQRIDFSNLSMDDVFDLILNARIEAKKNEDNYYPEISNILFQKMSSLSRVSPGYILKKLAGLSRGDQSVEASVFLIDLLKNIHAMPSRSLVNSLNLAVINAIKINQPAVVANIIQFAFSLSQETGNSVLDYLLQCVELRLNATCENLVQSNPILFWKRQFEESGLVGDGNQQSRKKKRGEFGAPGADSEIMKIEGRFPLVDEQQVSQERNWDRYRF